MMAPKRTFRAALTPWRSVLLLLFLYRCAMSVLAQRFISQFTTLGDFGDWTSATLNLEGGWYLDSTPIVANLVALFSEILFGNSIAISLAFQTLAFVGMVYLLGRLGEAARWRMVPLLFLPSFTLWSSIPSKEAVLVLAVSVFSAYLVDLYFGRERLQVTHVVALYLVWVFKPHYGAALFYFGAVVLAARYVRPAAFVALSAGLLSIALLFVFKGTLSQLSFEMLPHFAGGSTREAFWIGPNDVLLKAPVGMYESFFGPTLTEALRGVQLLHTVVFWEGTVLAGVLLYYFFAQIRWMSLYTLFLSFFSLFWIVFANYPFGVMNPGSAIRYRTGYLMFVFMIVAVLCARESSALWQRHAARRRAVAMAIQPAE